MSWYNDRGHSRDDITLYLYKNNRKSKHDYCNSDDCSLADECVKWLEAKWSRLWCLAVIFQLCIFCCIVENKPLSLIFWNLFLFLFYSTWPISIPFFLNSISCVAYSVIVVALLKFLCRYSKCSVCTSLQIPAR